MRKLTEADVVFGLEVCQDDIPVRGNALASGDDAVDKKCEDEILDRLDTGDVWAWALVTVTATWGNYEGVDHLGGCCYADEDDFRRPGGYFDDMKAQALDNLNDTLESMASDLAELA